MRDIYKLARLITGGFELGSDKTFFNIPLQSFEEVLESVGEHNIYGIVYNDNGTVTYSIYGLRLNDPNEVRPTQQEYDEVEPAKEIAFQDGMIVEMTEEPVVVVDQNFMLKLKEVLSGSVGDKNPSPVIQDIIDYIDGELNDAS